MKLYTKSTQMKKSFLLLIVLVFITSCNNSTNEISFLKEQISSLQYQNELLCAENAKLKKQIEKGKSSKSSTDIQQLGRWLDNRPGCDKHIITIFKDLKTKKYFIQDTFGDGSSNIEEARQLNYKGLKRYEAIDNIHNEFCLIEKNGDLSMWSQNGKFAIFPNY